MPDWLESVITVLLSATMVVGLFGLVVPIFPGNVVMWVTALVYGLIFGFGIEGIIIFIMISMLTVAAMIGDNVLMGAKARQKGASWLSIFLALGAGVLFTIIFPPIGGIIAAPLVLFAAEYIRLRDRGEVFQVLRGLLAGWGWGFLLRFALGVVVIILWVIWVNWG